MIICQLYLNLILQNNYICRIKIKNVMRRIITILLGAFCMMFYNNLFSNNENSDNDINKIITHENRFDRLIHF